MRLFVAAPDWRLFVFMFIVYSLPLFPSSFFLSGVSRFVRRVSWCVLCYDWGTDKGKAIIMATATTTKATRKNHFYVACWGYGIGVTDDNGEPFVKVLVFDTPEQAHNYATRYEWVDGNTYAEEIEARGAKALMRRQLTRGLQDFSLDEDDRAEMAGRVRRMGAAELVSEYRTYVFR